MTDTLHITREELPPGSFVIGSDDSYLVFTGKIAVQVWNGVIIQSVDANGIARIGPHTAEQIVELARTND